MPYIKKEDRQRVLTHGPLTAGELNYAITELCVDYYKSTCGGYTDINTVLGALEGAKHEFYHRIARPYEDRKWADNGDVYE